MAKFEEALASGCDNETLNPLLDINFFFFCKRWLELSESFLSWQQKASLKAASKNKPFKNCANFDAKKQDWKFSLSNNATED